ncbi:MAG TPA: SET domain-containing protein-lysine N-methyltransferase [Labilithrix sp.]|nr:SET domain-containing protein-lysine N-methyltransferase [Labilithrix sp.]
MMKKKTKAKVKAKAAAKRSPARSRSDVPYRLRRSPVHGTGLFATRAIRKGSNIIEYVGERISHKEADRRHSTKAPDDGHTFLFTLDSKTVIDGGVGGNASRFINHSCEPNCEVFIEDGHLYVEAARTIRAGEELLYDYNIGRDKDDPPNVDEIFACRCGASTCRGSMLEPRKKTRSKSKKKTNAPRSTKKGKQTKTGSSAKKRSSKTNTNGATTRTTKRAGGRTTSNGATRRTTKRAAGGTSNGPVSRTTAKRGAGRTKRAGSAARSAA